MTRTQSTAAGPFARRLTTTFFKKSMDLSPVVAVCGQQAAYRRGGSSFLGRGHGVFLRRRVPQHHTTLFREVANHD
jgi:hypothetical protein